MSSELVCGGGVVWLDCGDSIRRRRREETHLTHTGPAVTGKKGDVRHMGRDSLMAFG